MHKKRQQKIKRYRRSFNNQAERGLIVRRVLGFAVLLAVLFFVGWLVAEPALNFVSGMWYSMKEAISKSPSSSLSQPQSTSLPNSESDAPSEPSAPPETPTVQTATGNWAFVSMSALGNEDIAEETAKSLAAQGISCAVVTLKDDRGYIYYNSTLPAAANSIAEKTFDAKAVAAVLINNGITPVGYISAFKDTIAPKFNRDMAVTYRGQENYLWLDNSPELGGNPWVTPNSPSSVEYTNGIINEALDMGYKQLIVSNAVYPDAPGIESAYFAADTDTRERAQVLSECVATWQATASQKQGSIWFEYPLEAALDDTNKKTFGNVFALGMESVLLDYGKTVVKTETGATIDENLHDAARSKAAQHEIKLGIRISGGTLLNEEIHSLTQGAKPYGFQCFVVQ